MARSLNRASLIGNLTRDPELKYTPQGTAVCTFTVATNRQWKTESGEQKDDAEFHRIVAWDKLAEICGQMLTKGVRVFVEGRLQTRKWEQEGQTKYTTEIVISDMLLLDRKGEGGSEDYGHSDLDIPDDFDKPTASADQSTAKADKADDKPAKAKKADAEPVEEGDEDIPF